MLVGEVSNDELMHYGRKGMKWGVRRTPQQLGYKVSKLTAKNKKLQSSANESTRTAADYHKKSVVFQSKQKKYEKRLAKATAKKAKYDLKVQKQASKKHIDSDKVAKYAAKSAKYNTKVLKAQKKIKYNKYELQSEKAKLAAEKAKAKIAKNERMIRTYNSTIKALDSGTINRGRVFMKYVLDEQDR